jgi:choline dehydrogenase
VSDAPTSQFEAFDFVVVGAGSAGCVLANRLSEDGSATVLLLEAGGPDSADLIHVPLAFGSLFKTDVDWAYETEVQQYVDAPTYFPRGKTLGGSSSINIMIYARGNRVDYDEWAQLGCTGWDYNSVLPYFIKSENNSRFGAPLHGTSGPLYVEDRLYSHELSQAFVEAAVEWGMPPNDDFNGAQQIGAGLYQVTCHQGRRWSSADAYLRPACDRPNLTVRTDAQATRIQFDGTRAVGVAYMYDGSQRMAAARSEVVLSGGAINSPQLLMLSGVVVADLAGVGANLCDRVMVPMTWLTAGTTDLRALATEQNLGIWATSGGGPFASNGGEAGGFHSTTGAVVPDLQFLIGPTSMINHGFTLLPEPAMTMLAAALRPHSRGRLWLQSSDPFAAPHVDPAYFSDANDLELTRTGLRTLHEISQQSAIAKYLREPYDSVVDNLDDDALNAHIRQSAQTEYHLAGTCAMGVADHAVVDPELRVRGTQALRVVDASIMPTLPRGNINAPTIMIAERAADLIKTACS